MKAPGFYSARSITPGFTEFFAPVIWILYGLYCCTKVGREPGSHGQRVHTCTSTPCGLRDWGRDQRSAHALVSQASPASIDKLKSSPPVTPMGDDAQSLVSNQSK